MGGKGCVDSATLLLNCCSLRLYGGSGTDESRVERAGDHDVRGPLNDRPAVREERQGMRTTAEAEQQVVRAQFLDVGVGGKAGPHSGKVDGAVVLVDLD